MAINSLLCTDVYKMGHMLQYPEDTEEVYSYLEARKFGCQTVFFGLQFLLKKYLCQPITKEMAAEFKLYYRNILRGLDERVSRKIDDLAVLGYWPVEIKAVPEGHVVPGRNVLMTIRNTHKDFPWAVGFLESLLLKVWYPCSVATLSRQYYEVAAKLAMATCDDGKHLPFSVHDFGYRGVSSEESAAIAGAAHLIHFSGSDTITANYIINKYYGGQGDNPTINQWYGFSVPATEHSVMCAHGKDNEKEAIKYIIDTYPGNIVSIVSDTWDLWKVLTEYAPELKSIIMNREGKVVFRPDSGNPEDIICGDPDSKDEPSRKGVLQLLWELFGGSENSKGLKVLDKHVGLIYGDAMFMARYKRTLDRMREMGFASSNLVIGVGGLLLQQHNRDDQGFAIKATRAIRNGQPVELFKDPVTDPGKKSKKGLMCLVREANGDYITVDRCSAVQEIQGILVPVFKDGQIICEWTFDGIRENAMKGLTPIF